MGKGIAPETQVAPVRPGFWYELRVTLGAASLLPVLGLPVFALAYSLTWVIDGRSGQVDELRNVFEILLPLAAGLAAAHLMTVEHDEGFDELRRSYPEPDWRLPVLRTAIGLGLSGMALLLGALVFRWTFGRPYPLAVIFLSIPPAIYLLGLAIFSGNLSRSSWAAAGLVMGYWFFEIQTRGRATQTLFLFQQALPLPEVPCFSTGSSWQASGCCSWPRTPGSAPLAGEPGVGGNGLDSDESLYAQVLAGSRSALAELVNRYHGPLLKFLYRLTGQAQTAEDLAQETFIRLLTYQGSAPDRFRPWVFTIARNLARDHFRSAPVRREVASQPDFDPADCHPGHDGLAVLQDVETLASQASERRQVTALLQHLPANQREVIVLRFYHELPLEEIAEITGAPPGTVKSRLFHGLRRARRILQAEEV